MTEQLLPREAIIQERIQESPSIFTLRISLADADSQERFDFAPGQFNMVYLHGVGEIPVSIVSDPRDPHFFDHTIRVVGRVTRGLSRLRPGDRLGIRGPFGKGWPTASAEGNDVLLVTGGLGCAPLVAMINYLMRRRERFHHITLLQGVRHSDDMIWRERYRRWSAQPDVQVLLAADVPGRNWPGHKGNVVELFGRLDLVPWRTVAMLCGPEVMMRAAIDQLLQRRLAKENIWLSMERNMHCGVGRCGHCQLGPHFVCRHGPVFCYTEVEALLGEPGI
jgi:sulfhydrogenase subunit gamma (sulfur reductase)